MDAEERSPPKVSNAAASHPPPSGEAYRTSKDALTEDEVGRIVEARGGGGGADSIIGLSNADGGALGGACPRQTDRQTGLA